MKHFPIITILLISTMLKVHAQDMTEAESIIKEKIDTYLVDFYKGNLDVYADLFAEDGVYFLEGKKIVGQALLRKSLPNIGFPKVKYTHRILHIQKVDNVYVVAYEVTEEDEFRYHNTEIWEEQDGEFKIVFTKLNQVGGNSGIQPSIFVAGIVLFGFFLFLLLLVFRKAKNYKASKK